MKIVNHWLDTAEKKEIKGGAAMDTRRFLVIHNTAGWSAESTIEGWREKADGVLAHFIVDRDGKIFQCRACDRTAGHAGKSKWKDPNTGRVFEGLNSCSIGIEIANFAEGRRDTYPAYKMGSLAGKPIPRVRRKHRITGMEADWEVFPEVQVAAVEALSKVLVARYNLDSVLGHEDCSPFRKTDPGPAFPLERVVRACGRPWPLPRI